MMIFASSWVTLTITFFELDRIHAISNRTIVLWCIGHMPKGFANRVPFNLLRDLRVADRSSRHVQRIADKSSSRKPAVPKVATHRILTQLREYLDINGGAGAGRMGA